MPVVPVTERQFHAMLLPAIRHHQAICVRNELARIQAVCAPYGDQIEIVIPWIDPVERIDQIIRLNNPGLRERAMIVVYWKGIPSATLQRLFQVRIE